MFYQLFEKKKWQLGDFFRGFPEIFWKITVFFVFFAPEIFFQNFYGLIQFLWCVGSYLPIYSDIPPFKWPQPEKSVRLITLPVEFS